MSFVSLSLLALIGIADVGMPKLLVWCDVVAEQLLQFLKFRKPPLLLAGPDQLVIDPDIEHTVAAGN